MAAKPSSAVGSAAWISTEKENVLQVLRQEKEELIYPAQHEMEWLNEHMAEIFSRNQFNVTDVFKTPGKLRGKTPRTARKRNAVESRIPLSDVFSSKTHDISSPPKGTKLHKNVTTFTIAQDIEENQVISISTEQPPKSHTDSGYHGSSQEQVSLDGPVPSSPQQPSVQIVPLRESEQQPSSTVTGVILSEGRRTTEGSFHSAKEEQTAKVAFVEAHSQQDPDMHNESLIEDAEIFENAPAETETAGEKRTSFPHDFDDIGSPSDESTPDRPLVRKSSLTFASLPAREPLRTNVDNGTSRTSHLEQPRLQAQSGTNYMGRQNITQKIKQIEPAKAMQEIDTEMADDDNVEILGHDDSDLDLQPNRQYSKFSTQRLHEKIDMLGKTAPPRPSKSTSFAATLAASHLRQSEAASKSDASTHPYSNITNCAADDDDDWIKPLESPDNTSGTYLTQTQTAPTLEGVTQDCDSDEDFDIRAPELIAYEEWMRTPVRMSPSPGKPMLGFGHTKSASTATLVSPSKAAMAPPPSPAKSISVSNPHNPSTTPQGSPKRILDRPISTSKSKLQSIMKTARGLFTSSASVSAAAKMETLSPNALRLAASNMPSLYPNLRSLLEDKPLPASPPKEGRKTRSSTEKDKEARILQKMDTQLEKARQKEKQKAAEFKHAQEKFTTKTTPLPQPPRSSPRRLVEEQRAIDRAQDAFDMPPPSVQPQNSKLSRPIRPVRENPTRPKPLPVAIRVGTLSQRMPISTATLASTLHETLPSEPKRPDLSKKISNVSLQSSSSATTFKTSMSSQPPKPKALLAAERKKEQDEREALRKLEQKRETERRRAAQQEEARRQEQRQRAEAERKERERVAVDQAKRQAQQQAIERKRLENAKKTEQQRVANETAPSSRPPSRLGASQPLNRSVIGHALPTNPAKPAKRPLEDETGLNRPQPARFGAASQQADTKRRKTEDESIVDPPPRPTMSGAPIRQSNLGKKPSIFNHNGYGPVQTQPHLNQFPAPPNPRLAHPSIMAQYGNGAKIPFAEAPNPPAHNTKTPVSAYQQRTLQLVKSSPQYPNGEGIHLPEIPTDSEDEDSGDEGNAFPIPDWATPGHLTDQLIRQEGIDGDAVFGPIAPLKMEEIFAKGNKERLKRMRERTSSANWAMSGDGLTLEEVRVDREQRERMRVEGRWRYGG